MSGTAPPGWYPTAQGLRYWDGTRWTAHVVPTPSAAPPPVAPASTVPTDPTAAGARSGAPARTSARPGPAAWCGWGGLVLVTFLGGLSGGVSGFFALAGTYVLVVAVVALVRGRVRWARLRGRAAAGAALAVAVVLAGIGGATATPTGGTGTATPPAASGGSPGPVAPTTSASTPGPGATRDRAPTATPSPSVPRPTHRTPSPTPSSTPTPPAAPGTALAALARLPVKGRAPKTGYDRDRFGQSWADVDRNGCDTRNDVLRRDLARFVLKAGTHGCLVLSGTLTGPYTGRTIDFVRGPGTSSAVQVDHVVALSDAWQKGAQQLDLGTRTAFANDPLNLLAVDGPTNAAKGDGDAATWLPPRKGVRCAYVARQVAVKRRYHLWVTSAERDAIARILSGCPGQRLPVSRPVPLGGGPERTVTAPRTTAPRTTAPAPAGGGTDPRYGTCREALDHGYGHYVRGTDPEYDWYRDADGDGVVCE